MATNLSILSTNGQLNTVKIAITITINCLCSAKITYSSDMIFINSLLENLQGHTCLNI